MPEQIDFDSLADQATAPVAAPPPPGSANYDDMADQVIALQAQADRARAQKNLALAQGSNPDAEAKALQASRTLGIPQPAAAANLQEATQSAQQAQNSQALAAAPGLSAFIGSNPLAARLAQDDFDKLGTIDRLTTALKTGWTTAVDSNALGRLGNAKQAADLVGMQTPSLDNAIQTEEGRIGATPRLVGALGTVQGFTGFISGLVDNALHGGTAGAVAGGLIGGAAGLAAGGVGAVPGAVAGAGTGFWTGFNTDMALTAAGNAYLKMGQMRGADGQPLSEAGRQFGAIFTGAATYALGKYGGAIESKVLGSSADKLAQQAVEQAVTTPTFARAAASFAGNTAKGAAAGAVFMTGMEASNILGEQIAKALTPGNFGTDPQEIVNRLSDAALNGALTLGALHATIGGIGLYGDFRSAQRAQGQVAMFKNILDGAADSKLRQRDLDSFQQFMQQQTDGSPVEDLHIPATAVRELYQSMAIDPSALEPGKDPIFGFVPDMAKQLQEAQANGGDVVVPTADFVTHLAGSPIADKLLPDIRVGADAMSLNEAKQFQEEYGSRVKQAIADAADTVKAPDSAQQIAEDVRQRAVDAGRPDAEASRYGAIYASRYAARAERRGLGGDPLALYKAEAPQITGAQSAAAEGATNYSQGERGRISFGEGAPTLHLFANADSSTLMHESGHAWLEELASDAGGEKAPAQLRNDMDTVRKWLGNDGGQITDSQHEQFARAAEAYLMEGKAPSQALARVFSRFKQWLTKIYRTVASLDTPINDEIRGVFDRMLATDSELEEARKSTGLEPTFKDREQAGMTEAEWEAYTRSIDKAKQQAESAMLNKMMASVRRQRTKEFQEERTRVAEDVAKTVDARPDVRALKLLRTGKMPDGSEVRVRLNSDLIRETYGKEGAEALPKGITAKDGVSPDEVNEMLGGFNSGDELVRALQSLEGQQREIRQAEGEKRGIRQYLIDQETDARMAERKGELNDEASIKDEAQAALHGAGQLELLANEMRYLRRRVAQEVKVRGAAVEAGAQERAALKQKLGDEKMTARWNKAEENTTRAAMREAVAITRPMLEAMRQRVEEILSGKTTDELGDFNRYLRDERKAAREVQEAILGKDWQGAAEAKQRQIISHMLYRGARDASFEVDQGLKTFKRMASLRSFKTIDGKYVDQIQDLLGRFGFDSRRGEELQRTKAMTLEKFVETRSEDHGIELQVDPALFTMPGKPVSDLTLAEFRALREAVDSMREMGEGEKIIVLDGQKLNFEEVRDEMVAAIRDLGDRMKSDYYDPADAGKLAAAKEALFHQLRSIDASLTKPEALFDQIDRGDPTGIMNRAVFRRLKDAQHREDEWQDVAAKSLKEAVDAAGKGWSKHLNDAIPDDLNLVNPETGRPMKLTRQRMLSMALNWGNEGNRTKLAAGYKWDPRVIKSFLDRNMTKADWNFVQDVWGIFDKNRDALDALQKRVTGVGLDLVKADSFLTPHGEYAGGYFPVVYDAARSYQAEAHVEKANTEALFQNGFQRATTPKGSTIARVEGVKRAIQLSLDVAPRKIGQVIHDIAFREAIMDADRLLNDGKVKRALDDVFGSEYRKTLRPWLQHIANSRNIDDAAIGWIDKAIQTVRTNTVMVGIGFRLSTILKHDLTALANSIGEIGSREMFKATADLYRRDDHGDNSWKFIFDKSAEMRFRQNAYDKDVMASYNQTMGDSRYTAFQKAAQHYGHWAVSKLDMGTAGPVWLSSYRKALSEGRSDSDAVYIADKTVRNAHGAQGLTDTAQIQRARGAAQLINMFYGFFNHVYNRQRLIAIDAASGVKNLRQGDRGAAIHDFSSVLARSFWYIAVPGLIEAIVATQGPNQDKDEGWGEWAAKAIAGAVPAGIPILRDIARAAIEGRDYEGSPLVNAVNNVIRGGVDVAHMAQGDEVSPSAGKHIATAAGLVAGLPTAAPFTAGKFLWDYGTGEASPQSVAEWYRGLTTGKTSQ